MMTLSKYNILFFLHIKVLYTTIYSNIYQHVSHSSNEPFSHDETILHDKQLIYDSFLTQKKERKKE